MDTNNVDMYSDCSDSSAEAETNSNGQLASSSSDSSDDSQSDAASVPVMEPTRILKQRIDLPKGLCENPNIFDEFFSLDTWNSLPAPIKDHLNAFLPTFSEDPQENAHERQITVAKLFNNEINRFGASPLIDFQRHLEDGNYRPDISRLRSNIQKSQRREQKFQECERVTNAAKSIMISREKLLRSAHSSAPNQPLRVERTVLPVIPKLSSSAAALRAKKRYFQEVFQISESVGLNGISSDDENYPEGPPAQLSRKQRRHLSGIEGGTASPGAELRIISTMAPRSSGALDHLVGPGGTAALSEEFYRQIIYQHKKRKHEDPDHPELNTADVSLREIHTRTQLSAGHRRPLSHGKLSVSSSAALKKSTNSNKIKTELPTVVDPTDIQTPKLPSPKTAPTSITVTVTTIQTKPTTPQSLMTTSKQMPPLIISTAPSTPLSSLKSFSNSPPPLTTSQALKSGRLNQQFQQQLNKSQSLLMIGQPSRSVSESEEEDDDDYEDDDEYELAVKEERLSPEPGMHLSSAVKIETENNKRLNNLITNSNKPITSLVTTKNPQRNHMNDVSQMIKKEENVATILHEPQNIIKSEPGTINLAQYGGSVKAATLSDLEGIDMMHLPIDLDDSGNIDIIHEIETDELDIIKGPELMQETHVCYFSLIRDIFCASPNHRTTINILHTKISAWMDNPITALNDWYALSDNWLGLLTSAIHFLAGEFVDQPDEFVPYVEYKANLQIYQWIGAGRDSDQHLHHLCEFWLSRRNDMGGGGDGVCTTPNVTSNAINARINYQDGLNTVTTEPMRHKRNSSAGDYDDVDESIDRSISPPPPRCPTNWIVMKASQQEIDEFRQQERRRFDSPHLSFTYRMHEYESVVGPVKGIYTQMPAFTKARGHTMLTVDRPNFVTILTLVRDATARLPNGEGTRSDICELLRSSQYINPNAVDNVLQTIVSGALDRMHTEHDPCVRYDPKRKIWIYLHRNRTEEEFERMHQQFQGKSKHKKQSNRKVKSKKSPSTSCSAVAVVSTNNVVTVTPSKSTASSILKKSSPITTATVVVAATSNAANVTTAATVQEKLVQQSPPQQQQQSKPIPQLLALSQHNVVHLSNQPPPPLLNKHAPQNKKQQQMLKAELVPIKQQPSQLRQSKFEPKIEHIDVEASLDAHTTPILTNKHTSQKMPGLIVDNHKLTKLLNNNVPALIQTVAVVASNTTPIKISTSSGIQTVHVSTPTLTVPQQMGRSVAPLTMLDTMTTSSAPQNRPQLSPLNATAVTNLQNKKIMQQTTLKAPPPLVAQSTPSQHSYIVPISMNQQHHLTNKVLSPLTTSPKIFKTAMPALTSTSAPKTIFQQQQKGVVAAGKSLLSPSVAAANLSLQQQQATPTMTPVTVTSSTIQVRPQQQQKLLITNAITKPIQLQEPLTQQQRQIQNINSQKLRPNTISLIPTNAIVVSSAALPPSTQTTSSTVVGQQPTLIRTQQLQQQKTVIVSQHQPPTIIQKIISSSISSAASNTTAVTMNQQTNLAALSQQTQSTVVASSSTLSTSLLNPQQFIQIHQQQQQQQIQHQIQQPQQQQQQQQQQQYNPVGKVQTISAANLTQQQQQNLLKSIKQQNLRIQNQQATATPQQQSLNIKQQHVLHQIQRQLQQQQQQQIQIQQPIAQASPKPGISLLGANQQQQQQQISTVIATVSTEQAMNTSPMQQPPPPQQTRILKAGTSLIQHPPIMQNISQTATPSSGDTRTTQASPIMAKVLTNSSGQIISLESLLQKQGIQPGTTLRVSGSKPGQTSLIQLAGTPGSQITQYAVVSQGRNLISLGQPQQQQQPRLITTQASGAVTLSNVSSSIKTTDGTVASMGNLQQQQQQQQKQPHLQQTSQPQLINAKVLGVQGVATGSVKRMLRPSAGIRMVNASNLNIAHIAGKPILIASKTPAASQIQQQPQQKPPPQQRQNIIWHGTSSASSGITTAARTTNQNFVIAGQTGTQTVMFGNQVVKLHTTTQQPPQHSSNIVVSGSSNIVPTASTAIPTNLNNQKMRTVVLGSTGQTIRINQSPVQQSQQQQPQIVKNQGLTLATTQQQLQQEQPQQHDQHNLVVQKTLKASDVSSTNSGVGTIIKGTQISTIGGQQRVVLAVQGGGQILLPPGFQGGSINLKTLQGLKVIPIQQQQQHQSLQKPQTKAASDERQLFTQIISPQAPRLPNPRGAHDH